MINEKALGRFQVKSIKAREEGAAHRKWQACFYTLRHLIWQANKSQIFRDALERGILEPIAPPVRLKDGTYSKPEFDPDQIRQLYKEAWEEFVVSFDAAFIHASLDELVQYAKDHFGMDLDDLLALNSKRSAERFNR